MKPCPYCGQSIKEKDIDVLRAMSEFESEINRLADFIMKNDGIVCFVTACAMAKRIVMEGSDAGIKQRL